jgi:membrane-associated phospholipid phosphatase
VDVAESQSERPVLVPVRLRVPAWWLVGACLVVLMILAVRYSGANIAGRLDLGVESWLRTHIADQWTVLYYAAGLGDWAPILITTLLVACFGYFGGRWMTVLLAVLGPMAAITVTESLKPLIGRTINAYWALPSGHATALVSLLTAAAILSLDRRKRRQIVIGALMVLALAVGFVSMAAALVLRHLHYATDIVAGSCVGLSVVVLLALALDGPGPRR